MREELIPGKGMRQNPAVRRFSSFGNLNHETYLSCPGASQTLTIAHARARLLPAIFLVDLHGDLSNPNSWSAPAKILGNLASDQWYPQVLGMEKSKHQTDKLAGQVAPFSSVAIRAGKSDS